MIFFSTLGYDSHRFTQGKGFILGNVFIESTKSIIAHSDGDVLYHALIDALISAYNMIKQDHKDIGILFPDTEEKYQNIDSSILLKEVLKLLKTIKHLKIQSVDITILLESPKIHTKIRENIISKLKSILQDFSFNPLISIKLKTNEKMGFIGRNEGIAAICIVGFEYKVEEKD